MLYVLPFSSLIYVVTLLNHSASKLYTLLLLLTYHLLVLQVGLMVRILGQTTQQINLLMLTIAVPLLFTPSYWLYHSVAFSQTLPLALAIMVILNLAGWLVIPKLVQLFC